MATENKLRVLLVDDHAEVLKLLGLMFQKAGYEVYTAKDGHEALIKAREVAPNLILLDVMMPGLSGIEVCRQLRADATTAHVPIIMLSAKGQVPDKVLGFEAGADDYVTKPVARQELLARASALLQRVQFAQKGQTSSARIIAVIGAKGGVGATSVAVNVAITLVMEEKSVTLVELQDYMGTVDIQLNMVPAQDLGDVLSLEPNELGWREVNRSVVEHTSGLKLLAAPHDGAEYQLTAKHVDAIIDALQIRADFLFLDLPDLAGNAVRRALEHAHHVWLITEPEMLSIKAASAKIALLKEWTLASKVRPIVVSRTPSAMLMKREAVERALHIGTANPILRFIPPSPEAFQQSTQVGIPLVLYKPDILASQSLRELAHWLLEQERQ
ncbi:MAG: response regulator [Anaerolineae bacterium]